MELAHSITGSGPTLVLVHGVTHRRHAWDAVLPILAPHRRVVTVDLPGHGDSPDLAVEGDAIAESVRGVRRFLREVTPPGEKPHVAGNSLGGWLALELACRGEVASATALSPAGFFTGPLDQRRSIDLFRGLRLVARGIRPVAPRLTASAPGRSLVFGAFAARPWRAPGESLAVDVGAICDNTVIDRGLTADFTFSSMVDADIPITIGWGTRDLVLPRYQMRGIRYAFPRARVVPLRGLGHVPMTDDPERVARLLLEGSEPERRGVAAGPAAGPAAIPAAGVARGAAGGVGVR